MPVQIQPSADYLNGTYKKQPQVKVIIQAGAKAIIVANQTPSQSGTKSLPLFTEAKRVEVVCLRNDA